MENKRIKLELTETHRGVDSSMFTGRPQGNQVREVLKLNELDRNNLNYEIMIPIGTTSFNASFFLGLFFPSIKYLKGYDNFSNKYKIIILEENPIINKGLKDDLKDCERQARNEFSKKTGLSFL